MAGTYNVEWNGRYINVDAQECVTALTKNIKEGKIKQTIENIKRISSEQDFPMSEASIVKQRILRYSTDNLMVFDDSDNGDDSDLYSEIYWCFNSFKGGSNSKKEVKNNFFWAFVKKITLVHPLADEAILPNGFDDMRKMWIHNIMEKYEAETDGWRKNIDFIELKNTLQESYENAVENFMADKSE